MDKGSPAIFSPRLLLGVTLLLLGLLHTSMACSPPIGGYQGPTPIEYKTKYSDVVASGRVLATMPENPVDGPYSVDFQVYCIFKGGPLPQRIRIEGVGSIPGLCISTNLTKNHLYLLYLERSNNIYRPIFKEDKGSSQWLDEIVAVCEATVSYPEGIDNNNKEFECPSPYDYDDCLPAPTEPTFTEEPLTPPMPPTGTAPPAPPTDKMPPMPPKPDAENKNNNNNNNNAAPPKSPTAKTEPAENGASYESVIENKGDDKDKGDDRDAAPSLSWSWALIVFLLTSLALL